MFTVLLAGGLSALPWDLLSYHCWYLGHLLGSGCMALQASSQPPLGGQLLNGPKLPFQATIMESCYFCPQGVVVKSTWGQMLWLRTLDGTYLL